jgi:SSS family solute:Na+ symporter/sodium/pantothenate symporter
VTLPGSPQQRSIRKGTWCIAEESDELVRIAARVELADGSSEATDVPILIVTNAIEREAVQPEQIRDELRVTIAGRDAYAYGADTEGVYLRPPGPHDTRAIGFLSLGMAFSFFAFWPFGGSGQPSNMVRLMAFRNTRTLKLSIVTVAIYYSFLYFSLVMIFCCAKVLLPGMDIDADRVMPEMAVHSTGLAGVPWLAGFLLAAPFAAVMSSVDSFLLVVSSSLVCDIYKRYVNRNASERLLKRVTYGGTILVGILATLAALHPPRYLQDIIVQASGGLAASFLVPMALALYWKRMTAAGAITGMLTGYLTHFALTVLVSDRGAAVLQRIHPGNIHAINALQAVNRIGLEPFIWAVACSLIAVLSVSLLTRKPSDTIVNKYFDA